LTVVKLDILLAEDSEDYAVLLREALRMSGLDDDLHSIHNGAQVIWYLERKGAYADEQKYPSPDYLLLDLNLPVMHGFEVIKAIRAKRGMKALPIHVLSGAVREADISRAYALGATSYIVKPGDLLGTKEMLTRLHRIHEATSHPSSE
jgi:two-component system response regulator